MGAEVILGATALALAAGSTVAGVASNNANTRRQNELAQQEAEKNRQFQAQQVAQQNALQERMYRQYQSPEAVAQQLRNIGVNPASYFGSGKGSMTPGLPSVASPAAGSQAEVQMNSQNGAIISSGFKDAAQGISSLASAAKSRKEQEKLRNEAQLVLAQKYGQDLINNHQAIVNMVDGWSLNEKAKAEINDLLTKASLAAANKDYVLAQKTYTEMLERIGSKDFEIKSAEAAVAPLLFGRQVDLLNAQITTEGTKQEANLASASESRAGAALKISQKQEQEYNNRVAKINAENSEAAQKDMLNALLADLQKQAAQNKQQKLAAQIQQFRDGLNDPRFKSDGRKRLDVALDWLRQKFGFGVSSNISIK